MLIIPPPSQGALLIVLENYLLFSLVLIVPVDGVRFGSSADQRLIQWWKNLHSVSFAAITACLCSYSTLIVSLH